MPPTILNPKSYKDRFKRAMSNYFMSILEDRPSRSFKELLDEQVEQKRRWEEMMAEQSIERASRTQTENIDYMLMSQQEPNQNAAPVAPQNTGND